MKDLFSVKRMALLTVLIVIMNVCKSMNCQVKMRVRERHLIKPTGEPDTEETTEGLQTMNRKRRLMTSTVSPELKVAPTEPRIRMKHHTQILKRTTSRKRKNNKKRRYRPQVTYNESLKTSSMHNVSERANTTGSKFTPKVINTTKKTNSYDSTKLLSL